MKPRREVTGDHIEGVCWSRMGRFNHAKYAIAPVLCTLELPGGFGCQFVVDELTHREDGVTGQALGRERGVKESEEEEWGFGRAFTSRGERKN